MKKLYRSTKDKKLFGLCGGLAECFNIDANLLRIIVVVTTFFSAGTVIPLYLIASLIIPKDPVFDGGHSGSFYHPHQSPAFTAGGMSHSEADIDGMMRDLEKKAMQRELEQLREKLKKYEKGEQ